MRTVDDELLNYTFKFTKQLLNGKSLTGTNYKVHLDGYDQTNLITGKGPSNRHEILYFTESTLAFPGRKNGSLASRLAYLLEEIHDEITQND